MLSVGIYASCFAVYKTPTYRRIVADYWAATPLVRHPPKNPAAPAYWDLQVVLGGDVTVSIKASDAFSSAFVQYSDETGQRVVYRYVDYIYVSDLRLRDDRLFVLTHGFGGGVMEETRSGALWAPL
ncbi:MAG: hypothetical protein HYX75_11340 [Acidobacteria bacterium]|nr:hypothetical protein [Acidobacteriota bacterium]